MLGLASNTWLAFFFFFKFFDFIQSYEGKHLTTDTQMPFLEYFSLFYSDLFIFQW